MLNISNFLLTLPMMLYGMVSIFLVIGVIYAAIVIMKKLIH